MTEPETIAREAGETERADPAEGERCATALPLRITLPGRPVTKKNSLRILQRGRRKFIVPSVQFEKWQTQCGERLCGVVKEPISCGVGMAVTVFLPDRRAGDQVGYLQAACDVLEHFAVVDDDKWITVLPAKGDWLQFDKAYPRMEITLIRFPHPLETARAK